MKLAPLDHSVTLKHAFCNLLFSPTQKKQKNFQNSQEADGVFESIVSKEFGGRNWPFQNKIALAPQGFNAQPPCDSSSVVGGLLTFTANPIDYGAQQFIADLTLRKNCEFEGHDIIGTCYVKKNGGSDLCNNV